MIPTITTRSCDLPVLWMVVVNDTVEHGPMSWTEAEALRLAALAVPGVTDVEVREAPAIH